MSDSNCGSEPVFYVTIKVDCTSGLVVEVFNDLDQVGVNVIKPHSIGVPHCRGVPYKALLKVLAMPWTCYVNL